MKVVVLGGGVIGITTAYELARRGHEVTVVERNAGPAEESSYGNAGIIAPGHAYAWASPRAPLILLRSLWRDDTALRFKFSLDPKLYAWSLRFLANCTATRNRANTLNKLRLCIYSRDALKALRADTGIAYDETTDGTLYLYRDAGMLETGMANMQLLTDHGLSGLKGVSAARCAELEPALAPAVDRIAGAIHCAFDESGDSNKLCQGLVALMEDIGVTFRWGTTVTGLDAEGDRIARVLTDSGAMTGDAYVMSLASYTPLVTKGLGVRMPIYPVKGYSLTVSSEGHNGAPAMPVIATSAKVSIKRRLIMPTVSPGSAAAGRWSVSGGALIQRMPGRGDRPECRTPSLTIQSQTLFAKSDEHPRAQCTAGAVSPDASSVGGGVGPA